MQSGIANICIANGRSQDRAQALLETTFTAIADNATKQEKGIK